MPLKNRWFVIETVIMIAGLGMVVVDIVFKPPHPDKFIFSWMLIVISSGWLSSALYHAAFENAGIRKFGYEVVLYAWPFLFLQGLGLALAGILMGMGYAFSQPFGFIGTAAMWLGTFSYCRYVFAAFNRWRPYKS